MEEESKGWGDVVCCVCAGAEEISDGETRYAPNMMMGPDARCRGTMEEQRRWPGRDGEWCNGTGGKGRKEEEKAEGQQGGVQARARGRRGRTELANGGPAIPRSIAEGAARMSRRRCNPGNGCSRESVGVCLVVCVDVCAVRGRVMEDECRGGRWQSWPQGEWKRELRVDWVAVCADEGASAAFVAVRPLNALHSPTLASSFSPHVA